MKENSEKGSSESANTRLEDSRTTPRKTPGDRVFLSMSKLTHRARAEADHITNRTEETASTGKWLPLGG